MTHSLSLGSLLLTDSMPHDDGFTLSVLADGAGFGAASSVQEIVTSLLADGDLVRTRRYGNREVSFTVQIEGPTLGALALGEATLRREVGRVNTLTWQAPDLFAVPTVFEVLTSEMSQQFDDLDELRARRKFSVKLTCSPFARSADLVTVEAISTAAERVEVTISEADTPVGWTASVVGADGYPVSVAVVDNGPSVTASGSGSSLNMSYTWPAPVDMTGTRFLVLETSGDNLSYFYVAVDGSSRFHRSVWTLATSDGRALNVLDVGEGTVGQVGIYVVRDAAGPRSLTVHRISRSNTLDQVSLRQLAQIVPVAGTERTPASIEVFSGGATPLGMTIVHTSLEDGSGYSPPLRRWRVSGGGEFVNETAMSGALESLMLPDPVNAEVPSRGHPQGGYLLAARLLVPTAGVTAINWAAETVVRGVGQGYVTDFAQYDFAVPHTWYFVPLAVLTLPTLRSNAGVVRVQLSSPVDVELDEAWLFRVDDDCALTVVNDVGTARLWLDSPDITSRVPRVWMGDDETRIDAFHPGSKLYCHGNHTFAPDAVQVFTATSGVEGPGVVMSHYPRWHSNAAS